MPLQGKLMEGEPLSLAYWNRCGQSKKPCRQGPAVVTEAPREGSDRGMELAARDYAEDDARGLRKAPPFSPGQLG